MKTNLLFYPYVLLLALLIGLGLSNSLSAQNVAMHFDGRDDYIVTDPAPPIGYEIVIAGWFNSTSSSTTTTCTGKSGEILWHLGDGLDEYLILGECNGELFLYHKLNRTPTYLPAGPSGQIRGGWHHIAVYLTRVSGSPTKLDVEVRLDCVPVIGGSFNEWAYDKFHLGGLPRTVINDYSYYDGEIDDIKVYGKPIDPTLVCDTKRCIPNTFSGTGLAAYYSFDEGDPGNDNRSPGVVMDHTGNGYDAKPVDFNLQGLASNYIDATSPVFPRTDLFCPIITSVPFQADTLTQVCGGEPVHLCIKDTANALISRPVHFDTLTWVYSSGGSSFTVIDTLLGNLTCGVTPASSFQIDCTTSSLGYEDWDVRGDFKFKDGADSCFHQTKSIPLRICCGLDDLYIEGSNTDTLLCDMDTTDFTIDLLPNYPFLTNAASGVTIDWSYNGTPLPQFADQTSFNYNNIIIDVTQGACFKAKVDFPICGKMADLDLCFPIDPMPICGTIDTMMMPTPLNQISSNPKVYEICPGDDAALKIDQPFMNCIPTWQYSFDLATWVDMGSTNSQQNTNILPTSAWPGSNIYYRIECRPINDPSGCEPCHSDTLEIRLAAPLVAGTVLGKPMVCKGDRLLLTHTGFDPTLTHQWYCNGMPVGNGRSTFTATMTGCYWVESTDGCQIISTPKYCTEFCEVVAVISCPDVCPRPGVPITLSGCDSFDTCGKALSYQWQVTGSTPPTINGCSITHVPDPGGTTYTLIVINAIGCADMKSVTIVPCAQ